MSKSIKEQNVRLKKKNRNYVDRVAVAERDLLAANNRAARFKREQAKAEAAMRDYRRGFRFFLVLSFVEAVLIVVLTMA